jgi:hypothetical protein
MGTTFLDGMLKHDESGFNPASGPVRVEVIYPVQVQETRSPIRDQIAVCGAMAFPPNFTIKHTQLCEAKVSWHIQGHSRFVGVSETVMNS